MAPSDLGGAGGSGLFHENGALLGHFHVAWACVSQRAP